MYTQKSGTRTSEELLSLITIIGNKFDSEGYHKQLEIEIPQSGINLVSAEILYQLIKSTGQRVTRKTMLKTMDWKGRLSDKNEIVKRIFSTIEFEN